MSTLRQVQIGDKFWWANMKTQCIAVSDTQVVFDYYEKGRRSEPFDKSDLLAADFPSCKEAFGGFIDE